MPFKKFSKTKLNLSISMVIGCSLSAMPLMAEEAVKEEKRNTIEVIEVTAQKRTQSLQEVPLTISTVSDVEIQNAGINTIADLTVLVPGMNVYSANQPATAAITLRGAGTGASDPTLRPSVGIFIDGVYMPRTVFGIADLVDIDRVEVLMGPQGTLYGQNTNAGVVSVSTKGAPDEFELQAEVVAGNYDRKDAQLSVGFAASDDISFRLGAKIRSRDGYIDNLNPDNLDTLGDIDNQAFRGQMFWDMTDDLTMRAIAYTSTSKSDTNYPSNVFNDGSLLTSVFLPAYAAALGKTRDDVLYLNGRDRNNNQNVDSLDSPELKADGGSVQFDYDFGNMTLTSISAYQEWSQKGYYIDMDGTAIDIGANVDDMSENSFSQELRLSSFGGKTFDWVAGLFYFNSDLQRGTSDLNDRPYSQYNFGLPGVPSPAGLAPFLPNLIEAGEYAYWENKYTTESFAAFGQGTWYITENTTFVFGLRSGKEDTTFEMTTDIYDRNGTQFNLGNVLSGNYKGGSFSPFAAGNFAEAMAGFNPSNPAASDFSAGIVKRSGKRDDTDLTGMMSINYQMDDTLFYGTISTGAKSGGFNGSFGPASSEEREFDQEKTTNYEIGVKMDLLENTLRINSSYFYTVYTDFQAASFDPTTISFVVINAGEQTTQGVDVDLMYLITDELTLSTKVEYLDATYGDFKGANCHPSAVGVEWEEDGTCTLDGLTMEYAPEWSGSISLDYIVEVAGGEFYTNLNNSFKSDYYADPTRAAYSEENYSIWNARIGWRSEAWDISLWGQNITDETYGQAYTSNLISSIIGNKDDHRVWLNDPQTFGLTLRYNMF